MLLPKALLARAATVKPQALYETEAHLIPAVRFPHVDVRVCVVWMFLCTMDVTSFFADRSAYTRGVSSLD